MLYFCRLNLLKGKLFKTNFILFLVGLYFSINNNRDVLANRLKISIHSLSVILGSFLAFKCFRELKLRVYFLILIHAFYDKVIGLFFSGVNELFGLLHFKFLFKLPELSSNFPIKNQIFIKKQCGRLEIPKLFCFMS